MESTEQTYKEESIVRFKKGKVKCTLVQALRLCTAHRVSRGTALPFNDHGFRRG
jgi:hypothetical protein